MSIYKGFFFRLGVSVVAALSINASAFAGTIGGSAHDFTALGWSGGEMCVVCHTPHSKNAANVNAPLWNHADSTVASFTMYTSPSLDAVSSGQPAGTSRLCLSCHDGTIAVDSFGGKTGTTIIGVAAQVGSAGDLTKDHPISITYDTALATRDGSLNDPATQQATIGLAGGKIKTGTVSALLLTNGTVQCSSCHDVHNTFTVAGPALLKMASAGNTAGTSLCATCHNK